MLNDREREALHELERRLLSEDPRYSKSFDTEANLMTSPSMTEFTRRAYPVLLALSVAFGIVFFLVGSPLSTLPFLTVVALTWAASHHDRARRKPPR